MEKLIENKIDAMLESISTQLYVGSIILGIGLVIAALVLFIMSRKNSGKKRLGTTSIICLCFGTLAICSGALQI